MMEKAMTGGGPAIPIRLKLEGGRRRTGTPFFGGFDLKKGLRGQSTSKQSGRGAVSEGKVGRCEYRKTG